MSKTMLICLVLVAAAASGVQAVCPPGLMGPTCGTCTTNDMCKALTSNRDATCWRTFEYTEESIMKTYTCSTDDTPYEGVVTNVWAQCYTSIAKCDLSFALGGEALTCTAFKCSFNGDKVSCKQSSCTCSGTCPVINGVSLASLLAQIKGSTVLDCNQKTGICSVDVEGLSSSKGGFQAHCRAGECREPAEKPAAQPQSTRTRAQSIGSRYSSRTATAAARSRTYNRRTARN